MTPREALYYIILELGPVPQTNRDDNLNAKEIRLRDAVRTLQNFILYHDDANHTIPDSANEYTPHGKDRIEKWKKEVKKSTPQRDKVSPPHLQFGPDDPA